MESQKNRPTMDALVLQNSKKKKPLPQSPGDTARKSDTSSRKGQKAAPKRNSMMNDVSPLLFHEEKLNPDSQIGNEYRTLRRKYLLLEEESGGLGRELQEVEDEVKALEEEKISLLDELVVLEGLVDPSEIRSQDLKLP